MLVEKVEERLAQFREGGFHLGDDPDSVCIACPCSPDLAFCGVYCLDYLHDVPAGENDCVDCLKMLEMMNWMCCRCGSGLTL